MATEPKTSYEIETKRDHLLDILRSMKQVVVAFSGGIDSTVVAKAAFEALGPEAIAITADSPSVPRSELEQAIEVARQIGIRHQLIRTEEFENPDYLKNDGARCYYCKSELYDQIQAVLPQLGMKLICSGANLDDLGDYRPGLTAAAERHIRHPLQEAQFRKADVRLLAKRWGLPNWDKPASPCLSSRVAPGVEVTRERTTRIELAEKYLHDLGLRECRVRIHEGDLARIEVPIHEIHRLTSDAIRLELVEVFRKLGFPFITLDLQGFRSGSMNEMISLGIKEKFQTSGS